MKLLLIIPFDNLYKYSTGYTKLISYEPLTLSLLAALVPKEYSVQITTVDEGMEKGHYNKEYYDIVGISTVTSAANRAYELAAFFKAKGSYVVMGGHHVTLMPDEAIKHADTIFIGRSEKTWPQFFHDYVKGVQHDIYKQEEAGPDLHLPLPRRDLIRRNKYLKQPVIIANCGCKNKCNFCSISAFWEGCGGKRPISEVVEEIKSLNTKEFIFLDPNQYSDKEYAKELYSELIKLKIRWGGLSTHDIAEDDEMLKLMADSGCSGVLIGFESLNQNNLSDVNKLHTNVIKYRNTIQKLHDYKLPITGTFMIGFDHDTKESLLELPDKIEELELDIMRYGIVTPFPNTGLYHKLESEGRILTRDWSLYDSLHCVYQPMNMTPRELEQIFLAIWKKSYAINKILKRLDFTPNLKMLKFLSNIGFKIYAHQMSKLLKEKVN